ncbi:MAG: diguanylate cyclase [Proteobacteria bacterium]|nr:diguanylate cyclase [Pseudomonadota bacterium]
MTRRAKTRARADSVMTDAMPKVELDALARIDWGDEGAGSGRAESISDDEIVEVVDELPAFVPLAFAAFEGPSLVAGAQQAIIAAGHACAVAGTGRAGLEEVTRALTRGTLDALLVGIPGGEPLIEAARTAAPPRPVIIASCAGSARDAVARATALGADLVAMRPHDPERLAPILLAASRLHDERRRALAATGAAAAELHQAPPVSTGEAGTLQPFARFQQILEHELRRARRYGYPLAVALFVVEADTPPPGIRGILRARAGNALLQAIRDIDLATELDGERFLVLLPYTELIGATAVARRIIAAAGACDPVVTSGRAFPVRLVGAIAGARLGQPLSFARLMKDVTRALEQARRDGAELAVQP